MTGQNHTAIGNDILAEVRLMETEGKTVRAIVVRAEGWHLEMLDGTETGNEHPRISREDGEAIRDALIPHLPELRHLSGLSTLASDEGWSWSLRG